MEMIIRGGGCEHYAHLDDAPTGILTMLVNCQVSDTTQLDDVMFGIQLMPLRATSSEHYFEG